MTQEDITAAIEQIRRLAPAFNNVPDETLEVWVEMASDFVCSKKFGGKYSRALALFALHLMTLDGAMKGEDSDIEDYSKRLSSFSIQGEISESYATISSSDSSFLYQTPWGKMFQALRKMKGMGFGLMTGFRRGCR